jgi:hypothetical protein
MKHISIPRLVACALFSAAVLVLPAAAGKDKGGSNGNQDSKSGAAQGDKGSQKPAHQAKQAHHEAPPGHTAKKAHDWQGQRGWQHGGAWRGHDNWKGARAAHWRNEHRTWAQRGGYGGYYVPGRDFERHFGPGHHFRMQGRPVIYQGYPRFSHQGHSFLLVDPYPETWKANWYASDDVYLVYHDGYYLHNRRHPGYPLAVMVVR